MNEVRVILCTFPDPQVADRVATQLVEKRLAACVNLLPGVRSVYRWQGKIETDSEVLALIKTTAGLLPRLGAELTSLHRYEVPEIIALDPASGSAPYAAWLKDSLIKPD